MGSDASEGRFLWPVGCADRPFLWSPTHRWTHGAVAAQVSALAADLPGAERLLLQPRGGPHGIPPLLALWLRGSMAVLVDPREPPDSVERLSASARAKPWEPGPALRLASGAGAEPLAFDPSRPVVALRTSGTSGEPKFAVHRLASLLANARASNARVPFGEDDCWLLSLSTHHIGGLSILVRAMVGGGCVFLGGGPGAVAADLAAERSITHVSLVATQLRRLLDEPSLDRRMRSLRAILLGGGPTPAAWRREALDRGWPLFVTYGLTECASQVTTGRAVVDGGDCDAGTPLDGVDVRCAADGCIVVRGPTVFDGYLDGEPADGVCITGDLGRVDGAGRLHVTGRRDAMFISGGENVQPEEIENALRTVRGVVGVCVVAVDDPVWQKRPVAFVAGTPDLASIETALAALPRFKWPDRLLAMPADEAARAKPRRASLLTNLDAPVLWTRPASPE